MKKIFPIITGAYLVLSAAVANAQTAKANGCPLTAADFEAIAAIQNNPKLSAQEELTQELALRKQLIARTLSCATKDAMALKNTLAGITPAGNSADVASLLAGKIDAAINFYNLESAKLNDAGIRGTQIIAEETRGWRAANYSAIEGQIKNFALFSKNQSLFETADSRLTKTGRVVSLIENTSQQNDISTQFNAAREALLTAESENTAVHNALRALLSPDQINIMIRQSLQSLADAYQKFSDLNGLIEKFLPAGQ